MSGVAQAAYTGRFAPSPTGPLHAGSLVAALGSWLDARARAGRWLVRIEDVDTPRCVAGMDRVILAQLAACGLFSDQTPLYQSTRGPAYDQALQTLIGQGLAYPCACSRADIEAACADIGQPRSRHAERAYPGTCRQGLRGRPARAWRLRLPAPHRDTAADGAEPPSCPDDDAAWVRWQDRRLGAQSQDVAQAVGDFVLLRADGLWSYQMAVVVDDAAQGVTHVVRGEDLADNSARQILLQRALGLPTPGYLHLPLVMADNGEKLSKQNGAQALDLGQPGRALRQALAGLGLPVPQETEAPRSVSDWLAWGVQAWRHAYNRQP